MDVSLGCQPLIESQAFDLKEEKFANQEVLTGLDCQWRDLWNLIPELRGGEVINNDNKNLKPKVLKQEELPPQADSSCQHIAQKYFKGPFSYFQNFPPYEYFLKGSKN